MRRAGQLTKPLKRNQIRAPFVVVACVLTGALALSVHSAWWRIELPAEQVARDRPVPKPRAASEGVVKPPPVLAGPLADVASAVESIASDQVAIAVAKGNVEDYKRLARYPRDTEPIVDAQDPLLADDEVTPQTAQGPDGTDLVAFPGRMSFEAPGTALVHAYLATDDVRIAPAAISGSLIDPRMETVATVEFQDNGTRGDPVPGDHIYTAAIDMSAIDSSEEELASSYLVRIQAVTPEGDVRAIATSFQYIRPGVRLTGEFRDRLEDGNLVIEAEVEVTNAGHFHIEGTLYAEGNNPIALGRSNAELAPGRHWMRIPIYGLAFHDPDRGREFDGPYQLRSVALSNATQMPNARLPLSQTAYSTAPYRAADFSALPFDDPFYTEAVAREETVLAELEAEGQAAQQE